LIIISAYFAKIESSAIMSILVHVT